MANPRLSPTVIPLLAQLSSEPGYLVPHWFWVEDVGEFYKFVPDDTSTADGVDVINSNSGTNGRFKRIAPTPPATFRARGVGYTNVANLTSFTVAGVDGITYVANDCILLVAQTTSSQNGPYIVGTVSGGVAALRRPVWWVTGAAMPAGCVCEVGGEGTLFASSSWKVTQHGSRVIGTHNPDFYPRTQRYTVDLVAGVYTIGFGGGAEPLFNRGNSIVISPVAPTFGSTTKWFIPTALAEGPSGSASITVLAVTTAGALNDTDTSIVNVLVTNW